MKTVTVEVDVNYVAGSATATYDATRTNLEAIKDQIRQRGYHCAGEHPEVAAIAMSGSSALVAANALILKRTRLEGRASGGAAPD
jgi:hypothetical protein